MRSETLYDFFVRLYAPSGRFFMAIAYIAVLVSIYRLVRNFLFEEKFRPRHFNRALIFRLPAFHVIFTFAKPNRRSLAFTIAAPITGLFLFLANLSNSRSILGDPQLVMTKRQHRNFLLSDTLFIIVTWCALMSCYRHANDDPSFYFLVDGLLGSWCTFSTNFIWHVILIVDGRGYGVITRQRCFIVQVLFTLFEIVVDLLCVIVTIKRKEINLSLACALCGCGCVYDLVVNCYNFFTWKKDVKQVDSLPNATTLDLMSQDVCIFCRQRMSIGLAKRLPCHHCLHTLCLVNWLKVRAACPVCQGNLKMLLEECGDPYFSEYRRVVRRMMHFFVGRDIRSPMFAFQLYEIFGEFLKMFGNLQREQQFLTKQGEKLGRMPGVADYEKEEIDALLVRCNCLLTLYEKTVRDVDGEVRRVCAILRKRQMCGGEFSEL